ncbi:MAG: hypothetical protein RLY57_728 [Candidatus Parcubacteria bacterium]|jgi:hypothetical protein
MKATLKKISITSMGVVVGTLIPYAAVFAQNSNGTETNGNPYVFTGNSGSRVTGRGATGRFGSIQQLGMEVIRFIETLIVPLIMSLALLAFLWGVLQYIRKGGDPGEREQGRQFMLWGVIGLAVMASVWGLVRILTNTIGVPVGIPSLDPIK